MRNECPACKTPEQRTKWAVLRCCCPACRDTRFVDYPTQPGTLPAVGTCSTTEGTSK